MECSVIRVCKVEDKTWDDFFEKVAEFGKDSKAVIRNTAEFFKSLKKEMETLYRKQFYFYSTIGESFISSDFP